MSRWTEADVLRHQARIGRAAAPRSKYRNVKVAIDGERFDSKREAAYWQELKAREHAGEIRDLRRQVEFPLYCPAHDSPGVLAIIGCYIADFVYVDSSGAVHVEDVKGMKSLQLYRWKAKHLEA